MKTVVFDVVLSVLTITVVMMMFGILVRSAG
jgi:hypothetical protein